MNYSTKSVRKALQRCGLKPQGGLKRRNHQYWIDDNGRKVELAVRGTDVPSPFLKITADQMESMGICSRKEFKRLARSIRS